MAKFKVGQRVKIDRKDATITKTNAEGHWDYYYFKFDGDPRERGIHESEISANSSACNALKLEPFNPNSVRLGKSVWYKGREMTYKGKGGGKVHLVDLGGNRIDVPVFDRDLKMLADAYEYYHNDGVPMPNFRVCNSSNPVVRKAMNAVAMNAQTLDVGMKIVKWNGRKFVDGICDSWEKGKRRITAKFNDGSVRSLFAKDMNVHSDVFLPSQITQPKFQKGDYLHLTNMIKGSRNVIGGVVTSMYPSHEPSNGMMIWFYNLKDRIGGISKGMWEGSLAKNSRIHTSISTTNPIVVNALTMNKEEWRTTEGGHKICIEDGVVTKGNPHVVSKMQGKKSAGSRAKSKTASTKGSSKVDDSKIKISSEYRDLEPVHARFMTLLDKDEEKAKDYWKRHKREIKRVDGGMSGDLAPDYPWMK